MRKIIYCIILVFFLFFSCQTPSTHKSNDPPNVIPVAEKEYIRALNTGLVIGKMMIRYHCMEYVSAIRSGESFESTHDTS